MADAGVLDNEPDSGTANNNNNNNDDSIATSMQPHHPDDDHDTGDKLVTSNQSSYDSSDGNNHRCDSCDFETASKTTLAAHITQSHGAMETTIKGEADTGDAVDNNNQPASTATQPSSDRMHRKLFECDVCNMKFSNGANMRRHKMRHTGVKPYECRVCQKRFFRKDHLAEHFTTHTKTLPYHCPICNRGFQRQIAMRAHFQNEHVGQHDLVKSCPLCSYRAGSMKSLRVHFYNRHGIDLDNPGPAGSSSSLLAAAAAAQQGFPLDGALSSLTGLSVSMTSTNYSDSGDSTGARSTDNATPPMHFLTPHVEISMADAPAPVFSPTLSENQNSQPGQSGGESRVNGDGPGSPGSGDSNSNAPTSSLQNATASIRLLEHETNITPSISLIPIKQEPESDYEKHPRNGPVNLSTSSGNTQVQSATSSSLSSLIKVSPLKSLLRDDLKRKIVTRTNASRARASTASPSSHTSGTNAVETAPCQNSTEAATNGTITSTGPEPASDSSAWRGAAASKRLLASLQCTFCGIGFPDQTLYFLHKGCHSDANPWKCNICGEQCCNVYEFNSHLLSKSHQ